MNSVDGKKTVELICQSCGEKFYAVSRYSGKVKYCPDCRVDVYEKNQREQQRRKREARKGG